MTYSGVDVTGGNVDFRRRFGYVPEEPHLYPFLSGREYLDLVAGLRNLRRDAACARESMRCSNASVCPKRPTLSISAYSKGMKQKTLVIAALLHDPEPAYSRRARVRPRCRVDLLLRHSCACSLTRSRGPL